MRARADEPTEPNTSRVFGSVGLPGAQQVRVLPTFGSRDIGRAFKLAGEVTLSCYPTLSHGMLGSQDIGHLNPLLL
jgi:hypothetical protein